MSAAIKYSNASERMEVRLLDSALEFHKTGLIGGMEFQRAIYYDEITGVYRYKVNDWGVLFINLLLGLIFGILGLALSFDAGLRIWGITSLLIGLVLILLFFYRGFILRKTMVRVTTDILMETFPCRKEAHFQELMSHLKVAGSTPAPEWAPNAPQAQPAAAWQPPAEVPATEWPPPPWQEPGAPPPPQPLQAPPPPAPAPPAPAPPQDFTPHP